MYIHFKPDVYERLKFLATREEISVASFVAKSMEILAVEKVSVEYSLKEEDDNKVIQPEYKSRDVDRQLVSLEIKGSVS